MNTRQIETSIPKFEGLLFSTATIILAQRPELDRDDVMQRLRIKVWKGLKSYDPTRATQSIEGYVFSCITNEKKDIFKAKRTRDLFIEDTAPAAEHPEVRDAFELRYLSVDAEQLFEHVEGLVLPSTLTSVERQIVGLLYEEWTQTVIRDMLDLSKRALYDLLASIREKMADWRPTGSEREPGPTPPLPRPLLSRPQEPSSAAPRRSLSEGVCGSTHVSAARV